MKSLSRLSASPAHTNNDVLGLSVVEAGWDSATLAAIATAALQKPR